MEQTNIPGYGDLGRWEETVAGYRCVVVESTANAVADSVVLTWAVFGDGLELASHTAIIPMAKRREARKFAIERATHAAAAIHSLVASEVARARRDLLAQNPRLGTSRSGAAGRMTEIRR